MLSQRANGQSIQGIVGETFDGLDFRKCVGKGYYVENTRFDSCYINSGFFSQTAPFLGAVYLKFIAFDSNPNKYLAFISEYGYFTIIDFDTGVVVLRKRYKGMHNNDVIYSTEYKNYILVAIYGADEHLNSITNDVFVFDKKTFEYITVCDGSSISLDVLKKLNKHYPLKKQPRYRGYSPHNWRYNDDEPVVQNEIEYSISFDASISGIEDCFVGKKIKIFNAQKYITALYNNSYKSKILSNELFCFFSDEGERKLFVAYSNENLAIELQLDDEIDIRFLRDVIFTEDKKRMISYQTNEPWLYVWDLPSGKLNKISVSKHGVYAAACTADGKYVATTGFDSDIVVFDLQYGKQVKKVTDNVDIVSGCLLSDDVYAIGLDNGFIKLWNLGFQRAFATICAHTKSVNGIVKFGGNQVATFSADATIKIWRYDLINNDFVCICTLEHPSEVHFVVATADKIISRCWYEIIEWDVANFSMVRKTHIRDTLSTLKSKSDCEGTSRYLDINPTGRMFAISRSKGFSQNFNNRDVIAFYDLENGTIEKETIQSELAPDNLVYSPCGNLVAFEGADKVYVYDITENEPQVKATIQTNWKLSVFPKLSRDGYDAPGDIAFMTNIAFLRFIRNGEILVVSTREGVIFFYDTKSYEQIDVKCIRGSLNYIDYIGDSNKIIASDGKSIYIWNQNENSVNFLPNVNSGYVGCEINNLLSDDIPTGFLYLLERNGANIDGQDPKAVNYTRNTQSWNAVGAIAQTDVNNLLGDTFCDYGDAINIFMTNDDVDYRHTLISLNYLRSLYSTPAKDTIIPLLLIEGIGRFYFQKIESFAHTDYDKILSETFEIFVKHPRNKSGVTTNTVASIMAKCILSAVEKVDADFAYDVIYEKYIKNGILHFSLKNETVSIISTAMLAICEKQTLVDRVANLADFFSQFLNNECPDELVPFTYMKILFHMIKIQPQEQRIYTLDKMFSVYHKYRLLQEGFAFLYTRACDHFGSEYLFDNTASSVHCLDMIVKDLKQVLIDYPQSIDVLFVLATYLVALNGQKDLLKKYGSVSSTLKSMFNISPFKKLKEKPKMSMEDMLDRFPQLWEVKQMIIRMFHAISLNPDGDTDAFTSKLERIDVLLNLYYNYLD